MLDLKHFGNTALEIWTHGQKFLLLFRVQLQLHSQTIPVALWPDEVPKVHSIVLTIPARLNPST